MAKREKWMAQWEKEMRARRIYRTKERRAMRISNTQARALWPDFDFVKGVFRSSGTASQEFNKSGQRIKRKKK
jgi:hypothetical protein